MASNNTKWLVDAKMLVVVMVTLLVYMSSASGLMLEKLAKNIESIEKVDVDISEPLYLRNGQRHRRSANQIPDEIRVDIKRGTSRHMVHLKKTHVDPHHGDGLQVYRLNRGRMKKVEEQRQRTNKRGSKDKTSFFTDSTKDTLVMVKRRNKAYEMTGTMMMNGREYVITPDREYLERNGSKRSHQLCQLLKQLQYGLDGIIDTHAPTININRASSTGRSNNVILPFNVNTNVNGNAVSKDYDNDNNNNNNNNNNNKRQNRRNRNNRRRSRTKRQTNPRYVEIVFYCDFACYQKFKAFAESEGLPVFDTMRDYYSFIARGMALRYESITSEVPSVSIGISVKQLIVLDTSSASSFTESNVMNGTVLDSRAGIFDFRSYVRQGSGVPRADHWMLFTGYDLGAGNSQDIIGIAFIGRVCTDSSVSIIEEFFTGTTAQIASHELGHGLNSRHDSQYSNCTDSTYNVMAGVSFFPEGGNEVSNPWRFSSCTSRVMASYAMSSTGSCLQNIPEPVQDDRLGAGQTHDADEQCRLSQGPQSYFCRAVQRRRSYSQMCTRMYCFLPDESNSCGSVIALDKTSCGDARWCVDGVCQLDTEAPRVNNGNDCPQGDDPAYQCTEEECRNSTIKAIFCCDSCNRPDDDGLVVSTVLPRRENPPPSRPERPTIRPVPQAPLPPRPLPVTAAPRPVPLTSRPRPVPVTGRPRPAPVTGRPRPAPATGRPRPIPVTGRPRPAPATGRPRPIPVTGRPRPAPATGRPRPVPVTFRPVPQATPRPAPSQCRNSLCICLRFYSFFTCVYRILFNYQG